MQYLVIVIAVMGAGGFWYYKDSQGRIAMLTENNAKLEVAVQTQTQALESIQADYARASEELTRVNDEFQVIRNQNNVLVSKLQEHDIGVLGAARPDSIQRVINNASKKALRCFELLSGAELTEAEKEANSAQSFNSECPWLYSTQ
jgi:hypothetical protein